MSIREGMGKQNVVHPQKEILTYAPLWMNVEYIMFNEINQAQKDTCLTVWFHLYEVFRIFKSIEIHRNRNYDGGRADRNEVLMGIELYG